MSKPDWYTFKTMPPAWRNHELWPAVDVSALEQDKQARFSRLSRGVKSYLSDGKLGAAAGDAGSSTSVLLHVVNRCIRPGPDQIGRLGWVGCIGGVRLGYKRTKETDGTKPTGKAGSFGKFLSDHPDAHAHLDELIRKGGGKGRVIVPNPKARVVARVFSEWCKSQGGMSQNQYPFNLELGGIRSIERYIKQFIQMDPRASLVWLGKDYAHHRPLGSGVKAFSLANVPGDVVAMDSCQRDCIGALKVLTPNGPQIVAVRRIWLHICVDEASRCILGYSVCINAQITASTVTDALKCLVNPWAPRKLEFSGVKYLPNAGLPVGTIQGLTGFRPAAIKCDNAMQHYARAYLEDARRRLGCALTWGPIGKWWHNAIVERVINMLQLHGFQMLPSSTGSSPTDPLKPDSVGQAINNCITEDDLLDFIDSLIANHNASPKTPNGGDSPNILLKNSLEGYRGVGPLLRPAVPSTLHSPPLGTSVITKKVGGSLKKGRVRNPYVELDELRYSSPDLIKRWELLGRNVIVHDNESDIRTIRIFEEGGAEIGLLNCLDSRWAKTKCTRRLRKTICAAIRKGKISPSAADLVVEYGHYLNDRAVQHALKTPKKISDDATKLAELVRQTGVVIDGQAPRKREQLTQLPPRPDMGNRAPLDWNKL
ncbi:hypothetical protein [Pelomonas cellulosilytica]|uniref:Integrase catalytic domain-containing protein n=1 Tax=Pelomonas cellulosilytica TaxID=2906762 RepID=A0ABS8XT34_9BURK|nr:hypothetical protein [Pelomonas sp. P8]MCE4555038.1 hypothetical protein [Pelomonas sp. P8]